MKEQNILSTEQLELQARIAQRRIEKIQRILNSGVQDHTSEIMDKDTTEVVRRLYDTSLSDADISSCIDILEMLLLLEGLPPLLNLVKSETYNLSLRQRAARAISVIGSDHIKADLEILRSCTIPELSSLAEIALCQSARR